MTELLAELDTFGVTLGQSDGRPYLRMPDDIPKHRRAAILSRVAENRDAVIAHLRAEKPAPGPLGAADTWECVVCGREVDAAMIPLLANSPHYCSRGERRRRVTTAAGTVFGPRAGCPFKLSGGR